MTTALAAWCGSIKDVSKVPRPRNALYRAATANEIRMPHTPACYFSGAAQQKPGRKRPGKRKPLTAIAAVSWPSRPGPGSCSPT